MKLLINAIIAAALAGSAVSEDLDDSSEKVPLCDAKTVETVKTVLNEKVIQVNEDFGMHLDSIEAKYNTEDPMRDIMTQRQVNKRNGAMEAITDIQFLLSLECSRKE